MNFPLKFLQQEKYELEQNIKISYFSNKSMVDELLMEISYLKDSMIKHSKLRESEDWDTNLLLSELKEQNHRLSRELVHAAE